MKIDTKAIEKALHDHGYVGSKVKEIRKGRKYWRVVTDTGTVSLLDKQGWLREYPSKKMIKKVGK